MPPLQEGILLAWGVRLFINCRHRRCKSGMWLRFAENRYVSVMREQGLTDPCIDIEAWLRQFNWCLRSEFWCILLGSATAGGRSRSSKGAATACSISRRELVINVKVAFKCQQGHLQGRSVVRYQYGMEYTECDQPMDPATFRRHLIWSTVIKPATQLMYVERSENLR